MFYDNLCQLCKEKGVKRTNLVNDLRLSPSNMSNWKAGRTPKTEIAMRIAEYLDVTLDELMGIEKEPSQAETAPKDELTEYLEELRNRQEMRMLFSVSKGATKEEVEQAVKIIEALRK